MSTVSAFKVLLILNASWCVRGDGHAKKLESKHLIALSDRRSRLHTSAGEVSLRFRNKNGDLRLDNEARVTILEESGTVFLHSVQLAKDLLSRPIHDALLFLHFEQASDVVRATVHFSSFARLNQLSEERPELRFASYDLPPNTVTDVEPSLARDGMDADSLYEALVNHTQQEDPELFAVHTEKFLKAPHILVPLLSHLASLSAEDNLKFPIQLRRLSDQFRSILEMKESPIGINKIERNHLAVWTEAQNKRFAFVDGGVAKIAGLPGTEPTAMRVGIYCVRAGDPNIKTREQWDLQPFVVGDVIDKNTGVPMDDDDQMDLRRLGEAARYTLEPLTALRFIEQNSDVAAVFLHGPLINQFVMYDEGEPNFIPFLRREFLLAAGISQTDVEEALKDIPSREGIGKMWRQFMAIYGYIIARVYASKVPFVGVVERSAGSWLAQAVLNQAVAAGIVKESYKRKVMILLKRYNVSDDFLFGCVLAEGEYLTPTLIPKNDIRRARDIWQPVVKQYARPFATLLKTTEVSFPFRVEMNLAGNTQQAKVMQILYHTARLLPRYAFPVGLDIVDKYAKVPDWLSKNVSARIAARVLNRTIAEGDARLVTQVRKLLAHTPRDFFYRPQA